MRKLQFVLTALVVVSFMFSPFMVGTASAAPALEQKEPCNNGTSSDATTPASLTVTVAPSQNGLEVNIDSNPAYTEFSKPSVYIAFRWWPNWYTRKTEGAELLGATGKYTMSTFPTYLTAKQVHDLRIIFGGRWYRPAKFADADTFTFTLNRTCLP